MSSISTSGNEFNLILSVLAYLGNLYNECVYNNCATRINLAKPSDQISHSVVSDFLRPHELQYARPPCPSPTPRVHSDSRPSSQ